VLYGTPYIALVKWEMFASFVDWQFSSDSALLKLFLFFFSVVWKERDVRVNIFDMAGHPVFYEVGMYSFL